MVNTLLCALLAVLPFRYRERFFGGYVPEHAALFSGVVQALVCMVAFIARFFPFMNARLNAVPLGVMAHSAQKGGESLVMALGPFYYFEYIFQLSSLLLIYLALEGIARAGVAIASGEVLPNLFLAIIAHLHGRAQAESAELRLGRRVADEVTLSDDRTALRIASCRRKPWHASSTIGYKDELYVVCAEEFGEPARPYVYLLERRDSAQAIRGIHTYHPDEALRRTWWRAP